MKGDIRMKQRKWSILLFVHTIFLLWALLFICGLLIFDYTNFVFAFGNLFFLFANIPVAILSFVLMSKDCFHAKYKIPIAVLSVLNSLIGITAWYHMILLIQKAALG